MSFLAQCVFCGHRARAPDDAVGASGRCPKCGSFFTLVPEQGNAPAARTSPAASVPSAAAPGITGPAAVPTALPFPGPPSRSRWTEPLGLGALVLSGVALWCTATAERSSWVVPLAGTGLVLGLGGILHILTRGGFHLRVPMAGTLLASTILGLALVLPGLLDHLRSWRGKEPVGSGAVQVVPLAGGAHAAPPRDAEWVNARQASLQQGPLSLQVLSAWLQSVKANASAQSRLPPGEYLFLRLRTRRVETGAEFAAKKPSPPGALWENLRPRLLDRAGQAYALLDVQEVTPRQNGRKSAVFPVIFRDEILAFEAPAPGGEDVQLEVDAAGGSQQPYRFLVPASMITDKRPRALGASERAGRR